jgi:hypothetical protein
MAQAYWEPEDYLNLVSREEEHAKSDSNVPSNQAVLIALLGLIASATMLLPLDVAHRRPNLNPR